MKTKKSLKDSYNHKYFKLASDESFDFKSKKTAHSHINNIKIKSLEIFSYSSTNKQNFNRSNLDLD